MNKLKSSVFELAWVAALFLSLQSSIAPKLGDFELQEAIEDTIRARFGGDHEVIRWRREHSGYSGMEVVFSGEFTRADEVTLRFPTDLMGHLGVMVFWSLETPASGAYLQQVHELQARFPDRIKVFSFNLDELADGGTAALRELGLDWTVMRLPGGTGERGIPHPRRAGSKRHLRQCLWTSPPDKDSGSGRRVHAQRRTSSCCAATAPSRGTRRGIRTPMERNG